MKHLNTVLIELIGIGIAATGCMNESSDDPADTASTEQALVETGCTDPTGCAGTAAVNDDFSVSTTNGCGRVNFIDHGEGAPGGGDNDDYAVIHDLCGDGHGVKAWAWLNGVLLGSRYNGNGLAGAAVIWDPFGNVAPGDLIGLKVCLVDGSNDPSPSNCASASHRSVDG
jgi:hypothetical protein